MFLPPASHVVTKHAWWKARPDASDMGFRLVVKREAWCLTWWGRLFGGFLTLSILIGATKFCAPFLTLNRPISAEVLIVEGWLPDYALKGAVEEFHRGKYHYVITAGSPLLSGYYFSSVKTSADLAAASMIALGLASNLVRAVPAPMVLRGRSLAHAQAVSDWIEKNDPGVK